MLMTPNSFPPFGPFSQMPESSSQLPRKQGVAFSALECFQSVCHRDPLRRLTPASYSLLLLLLSSSAPRLSDLHLTEEVVVGLVAGGGLCGTLCHAVFFQIYSGVPIMPRVIQTLEVALQKVSLLLFFFSNLDI